MQNGLSNPQTLNNSRCLSLQERLRTVRSRFNGRVKSLITDKSKEMDKVEEKNTRLLEIIDELGVSDKPQAPHQAATHQSLNPEPSAVAMQSERKSSISCNRVAREVPSLRP